MHLLLHLLSWKNIFGHPQNFTQPQLLPLNIWQRILLLLCVSKGSAASEAQKEI